LPNALLDGFNAFGVQVRIGGMGFVGLGFFSPGWHEKVNGVQLFNPLVCYNQVNGFVVVFRWYGVGELLAEGEANDKGVGGSVGE